MFFIVLSQNDQTFNSISVQESGLVMLFFGFASIRFSVSLGLIHILNIRIIAHHFVYKIIKKLLKNTKVYNHIEWSSITKMNLIQMMNN